MAKFVRQFGVLPQKDPQTVITVEVEKPKIIHFTVERI